MKLQCFVTKQDLEPVSRFMPKKATRKTAPKKVSKKPAKKKVTKKTSAKKKSTPRKSVVKKVRSTASKRSTRYKTSVQKASVKASSKKEPDTAVPDVPEEKVTKRIETSKGVELREAVALGKKGKEPSTMEELLNKTGYKLWGVKRGELVEGQITDISKRMALIDIGAKTEGLVVDKEYEAAKEFIQELAVGDTITVYVLSPENDRGQILLSLKKAATDRTWDKFHEALKTSEIVTVRGLDVNRGGVIVRADSLQGFVPSSQFGKQWLGKMDELVERTFQVRVIEVDREKNRLIFSEKQVSEADEIKQRSEALKKIKVNEEYAGVVSGIMPFGVFVSVDVPFSKDEKSAKVVGKVEGLVHISEISWEKVDDPNKHFRVGEKLNVRILGIDQKSGKLNLSVKRLSDDPWSKLEKKYPPGKKVKGSVSRVAPFGAFVTLEPGVEGLLHISKIPAGEEPEVDSKIEVYVEQVDLDNRRMSLGMVLTEVPVAYK